MAKPKQDPRDHLYLPDWESLMDSAGDQAACARPSQRHNRAWTDGNAPSDDVLRAVNTCRGCPLLAKCRSFTQTKEFAHFDGVMGGIYRAPVPDTPRLPVSA